jgi:hypothetical protein
VTTLDQRLRALGDALDLDLDAGDGDGLADAVLARLDEPPPSVDGRPLLRVAAAVLIVLALVAVAVPSSRRTVADWFGFDGVRLERRPGAPAVSVPDPLDRNATAADSSSDDPSDDTSYETSDETSDEPAVDDPPVEIGTIVEVDDREVLVSEFVGTLDNPAIGKTVGDGTAVRQVEVSGELGLWIDGAPHDVSFFDEQGDIAFRRFAGNTLLWQDGSTIRRLEGFADADAAIEYAEQLGG